MVICLFSHMEITPKGSFKTITEDFLWTDDLDLVIFFLKTDRFSVLFECERLDKHKSTVGVLFIVNGAVLGCDLMD